MCNHHCGMTLFVLRATLKDIDVAILRTVEAYCVQSPPSLPQSLTPSLNPAQNRSCLIVGASKIVSIPTSKFVSSPAQMRKRCKDFGLDELVLLEKINSCNTNTAEVPI